jgi:hypothetical protein
MGRLTKREEEVRDMILELYPSMNKIALKNLRIKYECDYEELLEIIQHRDNIATLCEIYTARQLTQFMNGNNPYIVAYQFVKKLKNRDKGKIVDVRTYNKCIEILNYYRGRPWIVEQ